MREPGFHPFVAADYERIRDTLLALAPASRTRPRFLEWGSASGIITIMADLVGFEAYGIELDPSLVATARELAVRHASNARFVAGSFLPAGYRWRDEQGDTRTGTIGEGPSGYQQLGLALDDFDLVFGYPWDGEEALMLDVMQRYGRASALLLVNDPVAGVRAYRGGKVPVPL